MAGNGVEATSDINIDTKRSSTAVVREALFRATGEQRWTDDDEWGVFLVRKASHSSFTILTTELLETTIHCLQQYC
jgi:septin family protein